MLRSAAFPVGLLLAAILVLAGTALSTLHPYLACGLLYGRNHKLRAGDSFRCVRHVRYDGISQLREIPLLASLTVVTSTNPRVLRIGDGDLVSVVGPGRGSLVISFLWMRRTLPVTAEPAVARAEILVSDSVVRVGDTVHVAVRALAADGQALKTVPLRISYLAETGLLLGSPVHPVVPTKPGPMTIVGIAEPARDSVVIRVLPRSR